MAKTRDERTDSSELPLVSNLFVTMSVCGTYLKIEVKVPCAKRESVPGQTCFSIIDDKMVQGTVACVALLSSRQAHFSCISSLVYLCMLQLSSIGASGTLAPHHCVYSPSSVFQSVRTLLAQKLSKTWSCVAAVGGRDEFVPCSPWLVAICIYRHARSVSALLPPSSCLLGEKGRAALQGEMNQLVHVAGGGGIPAGTGGRGLGHFSLLCGFPHPFGTLKERDGGGCGFVLGKAG